MKSRKVKNRGLRISQIWIQILVLSLITCMHLSKLGNLSDLFLLICGTGVMMPDSPQVS